MANTATSQLIITNAAVSGTIRHDTFDGREWLIVPVVAVVQGVLNGEFAPAAEIERSLPSWDGRPVTVGHPRDEVDYVSANDPAVLESWGLGYLFSCQFDSDRLKGEMWLDLGKADRVGGELAAAVARFESGKTTEVSTGYWRDTQARQGAWNGKEYAAVQTGILPDHLAILLDAEGACNWQDGCGAPRVNTAGKPTCNCHKEKNPMKVTINVELSLDEQLHRVYEAFVESFTRPDGMMDIWPREVFSEVVIASNGPQLLAYPWTADDEGMITFAAPKVVEVVYQDVESGASVIGNTAGKQAGLLRRAVNQLVAALYAPSEAMIRVFENTVEEEEPANDDPETPAEPDLPAVDDVVLDSPAASGEGDEIVTNEVVEMVKRLGGAAAVERDILAMRANAAAERETRIGRLVANSRVAFTQEQLAVMDNAALEAVERMAVTADYGGRGLPRPQVNEPDEEPYVRPVIQSRNGTAVAN